MLNKKVLLIAENYKDVGKYIEEFRRRGLIIEFLEIELKKPICDNLQELLFIQIKEIYEEYKMPCIIFYKGLYINRFNLFLDIALDYSGVDKVLEYVKNIRDRSCSIKESMVYFDGTIKKSFLSIIPGTLADSIPKNAKKGSSKIELILKPSLHDKTFSELDETEKKEILEGMVPDTSKQFLHWYMKEDLE